MRRAAIIAAAGCSARFRRSVGRDVLKVLYYEQEPKECLLSRQLDLLTATDFAHVVIVGGYNFQALEQFIRQYHAEDQRISLVYNGQYEEFGTCFTFACGLNALELSRIDQVVLIEGDLFFERDDFQEIVAAESDVITANSELICADKSVVFYIAQDNKIFYTYDTAHRQLRVDAPFSVMGNSGQVWKFCDPLLLANIVNGLGSAGCSDTNLLPIEQYLNVRGINQAKVVKFGSWFNCNTIDDFHAIVDYLRKKQVGH